MIFICVGGLWRKMFGIVEMGISLIYMKTTCRNAIVSVQKYCYVVAKAAGKIPPCFFCIPVVNFLGCFETSARGVPNELCYELRSQREPRLNILCPVPVVCSPSGGVLRETETQLEIETLFTFMQRPRFHPTSHFIYRQSGTLLCDISSYIPKCTNSRAIYHEKSHGRRVVACFFTKTKN